MRMKNNGFTLIEVLIALAILSIALTAIIKSTSQNIKDTLYIQNKTIANWVANEIVAEAEAGILKVPDPPDKLSDKIDMLGQKWLWQASIKPSPNPKIKELNVSVSLNSNKKIIQLTGYLYAQ